MRFRPFSPKEIKHDMRRFGYSSMIEYVKNFNASAVSTNTEIYVAKLLGGRRSDSQNVYDVYNCTKTWATKIELRGITEGFLNFSRSTDTGKDRSFDIRHFREKIAHNNAYVVINYTDLIYRHETPRMYLIPVEIVEGLYDLGVLPKAQVPNAQEEDRDGKRFRLSGVAKHILSKGRDIKEVVMSCNVSDLRPNFDDLFPYEIFYLDLSLEKRQYPSVSDIIDNARLSLIKRNILRQKSIV